jgi:hypothetical protein
MLIDFRIDGHMMGEEVACAAPPKLSVKVRGAAELAELVIFRDREIFASLGRSDARKGATQDLKLTLDLGLKPKEGETWQLTLAAPGCELQRDGDVIALHRRNPNPPYARWRVDKDGGAAATFIWPGTFTPDEVDHIYRLDVSGPLGSKLTVAWGEQTRTVTVDELLAGPIRGTAPRGALVAITSGANMNFARLGYVAERAAVGEHREAILAVTIPERPGAFLAFCAALGARNVTEFNYRLSSRADAHIFVGIEVASAEEARAILAGLARDGYACVDLSGDDVAKTHIRHMVGGRTSAVRDEVLYDFEFPERPGALLQFLTSLGSRWNVSLFHYRNHGAAFGRVLCGLEVPPAERDELRARLDGLGFSYAEATDNPAGRFFLR